MSACIPGVLFIQQSITAYYSTCFIAAVTGVALEQVSLHAPSLYCLGVVPSFMDHK